MMRELAATAFVGIVFGYALSRIGFTSWDEVHSMFTFASLRLTLGFALSLALLFVGWKVIARVQKPGWPRRGIHPGIIPGSVLFGIGWALSGACPSIALVQVGEGQLGALWTLAGIVFGNYVYSVLHERFFRWPTSSCVDA
jgi:uncharacterized membrane protein YedE/YeeE